MMLLMSIKPVFGDLPWDFVNAEIHWSMKFEPYLQENRPSDSPQAVPLPSLCGNPAVSLPRFTYIFCIPS